MTESTLRRLNKTKDVLHLIEETCSGTSEIIDECVNGERTLERMMEDLLAVVNGIRRELEYIENVGEHQQAMMRYAKDHGYPYYWQI